MGAEEIRHIPASVDFSKVPESLDGKWVVVQRDNQTPLGFGDTPQQAFDDAGIPSDTDGVVIARVPSRISVFAGN